MVPQRLAQPPVVDGGVAARPLQRQLRGPTGPLRTQAPQHLVDGVLGQGTVGGEDMGKCRSDEHHCGKVPWRTDKRGRVGSPLGVR